MQLFKIVLLLDFPHYNIKGKSIKLIVTSALFKKLHNSKEYKTKVKNKFLYFS